MLMFVYNPGVITEPEPLAEALGIGQIAAYIPPRYERMFSFPDAGYFVLRETWQGVDMIPGPVTAQDIADLPDPGPDPAIAAAEARVAQQTVLDVLSSTPIDLGELEANLAYLAAFVTNPAVAGVARDAGRMATNIATMVSFVGNPAPTNADAIAAIKAICEDAVIVDRVALAVLADTIRYLIQRP